MIFLWFIELWHVLKQEFLSWILKLQTVHCPIILSFIFQWRSGWGLNPPSPQPQCDHYSSNFWIKLAQIHIVFKSYLKPSALIHGMQWLNNPFLFQIINTEWKVNLYILFNSVRSCVWMSDPPRNSRSWIIRFQFGLMQEKETATYA